MPAGNVPFYTHWKRQKLKVIFFSKNGFITTLYQYLYKCINFPTLNGTIINLECYSKHANIVIMTMISQYFNQIKIGNFPLHENYNSRSQKQTTNFNINGLQHRCFPVIFAKISKATIQFRSSRSQMFFKIAVLKNSAIFTG